VRRWTERTSAPPEDVWPVMARPSEWSRWAPHIRGAWGLGDPEVEEGKVGLVRLGGVIPVPARITAVEPGRSWTWFVPTFFLRHEVVAAAGGSEVALELWAPGVLEPAAAGTYGRVFPALLGRLAEQAAEAS
jgi:hypothetical protein